MEVLDKIQANINRFFKIVVKRQPGYDVCWVCGMPFEERDAEFCEVCLPPGNLIQALPYPKPIEEIRTGDYVLSHDGIFHRVTKTYERNYDGPLYTIKPLGLPATELTPEHPIFAAKCPRRLYGSGSKRTRYWVPYYKQDIKLSWIEAHKVSKGYLIGYPVPLEEIDRKEMVLTSKRKKMVVNVDYMFCRMLGYYIAEGSPHRETYMRSISFSFNATKDKELVEDLVSIIKKHFGKSPRVTMKHNSAEVVLNSAPLTNFFAELGHAWEKYLPSWAFLLPEEKQRQIMKAMWLGDGHADAYTTTSKKLALQLMCLLLRIGIIPSIHHRKAREGHRESWSVEVEDSRFRKILNDFIPLNLPIKKGKINRWFNGIHAYVPISWIKIAPYKGLVYNLEVEHANSYTTGGLALHNCHTFKCPYCGSCLCSLSESTRKALDAELYSVGLWSPYENSPKRKRRRHH